MLPLNVKNMFSILIHDFNIVDDNPLVLYCFIES